MNVFSELVEAQVEVRSSDATPGANKKGHIYQISSTEPLKVSDGTQIHAVITDKTAATKLPTDTALVTALATASAPELKPLVRYAPNYTISSGSGNWSTTFETFTDITNLSVSITTTGRPVEVRIVQGNAEIDNLSSIAYGKVQALRGATSLGEYRFGHTSAGSGATGTAVVIPGSSFYWIDTPAAGTYTYKLQALSEDSNAVYSRDMKLMVREL